MSAPLPDRLERLLRALEDDIRRRENGSSWDLLQKRLEPVQAVRREIVKELERAAQGELFRP